MNPEGPTSSSESQRLPPLTKLGMWVVALGMGCLVAAGATLVWGDSVPVATCSTVKTSVPKVSAAAGPAAPGKTPSKRSPEQPGKMTQVKEVESCSPSGLSGGLALLLTIIGVLFILPGLLRILPPGKYEAPGVGVDTSLPAASHYAGEAESRAVEFKQRIEEVNAREGQGD